MENHLFYVGRDKDGELTLYNVNCPPYRVEDMGYYDPDFDSEFMNLPKEMFPEVTWETGLKMVELKIKE